VKRQPSVWEKIIANEATDKQLISKIYKQLLQLNSRKINDPIKNWAKELLVYFLNCFGFAYGCICIFVYSATLFIVVFAALWSFPFFFFPPFFLCPFLFLFYFYNFNFYFFNLLYFSTYIPLFAFPTVLFPLELILNVYKSSLSTSI